MNFSAATAKPEKRLRLPRQERSGDEQFPVWSA